MSFLESLSRWFRREAADVRGAVDDLEATLDADLTRKERELAASPEERLEMIQDEIEETGDPFDEIRDKLDSQSASADADRELNQDPGDHPDGRGQLDP